MGGREVGGSGWEGGPRGEIYVYIYIWFTVIQQKLTQHCKAIILQFKKIIQAQKKKLSSSPAPSSTSDEELSCWGVPFVYHFSGISGATKVRACVTLVLFTHTSWCARALSLSLFLSLSLSLFFFLAASHGMWDLSSLTRAHTHTPCSGRWSLNQWTTGNMPPRFLSDPLSCAPGSSHKLFSSNLLPVFSLPHPFSCFRFEFRSYFFRDIPWFPNPPSSLCAIIIFSTFPAQHFS